MKKLIYLFLLGGALIACSEEEDEFKAEIPDPDPVNPIEEPVEDFILKPSEVRGFLVDPTATDETVALFYHLKTISKTNFIVGQQDAFSAFYQADASLSDMKKLSGSDPGMLGSDFMFITDDNNNGQTDNWFYQQEQTIIADAIEAYDKGMINAFTWHLREPYEGEAFYTAEMTEFQKENAFKSILPGGANHEYYKEKLQKIAEVVQSIKGSDGSLSPVIFRPFHEFDGEWFWWGAAYNTAEEFKTAWRFTVEYLRDELNVHNLLFAYSPDNSYSSSSLYLQRYPGDEYVDILGMDNYGDFRSTDGSQLEAANAKLKMISDLAIEKVKIAALTETGFFVDAQNTLPENFFSESLHRVLTDNEVEIAFMMFWSNSSESYTVPVPGQPGEADFLEFIQKEEPLLLDEMINYYKLPN